MSRLIPEITRANIGITETVITASPAFLLGLIGNDANSGFTEVRDAAATASGQTPKLKVNLGDGGEVNCHGSRFDKGIVIDGELAAHDVTVIWAPTQ